MVVVAAISLWLLVSSDTVILLILHAQLSDGQGCWLDSLASSSFVL